MGDAPYYAVVSNSFEAGGVYTACEGGIETMDSQGEITRLLTAWGKGDPYALNQLMPLVYAELHRIARLRLESAPA